MSSPDIVSTHKICICFKNKCERIEKRFSLLVRIVTISKAKKKKRKPALKSSFKLSYDKAFKQADTTMRYQVCPP